MNLVNRTTVLLLLDDIKNELIGDRTEWRMCHCERRKVKNGECAFCLIERIKSIIKSKESSTK